MAKFTKAVLKVGETMQSPDGPVAVTAERLAHFAAEHKKLTASGYHVPSRWEHASETADLLPLSTDDLTKKLDGRHAVGKMVDFEYKAGADQAELTLEVSDARAAEQCESNRVKVSPVIAAWWKDGRGNEYRDFLSHADLVERPVDYTQGDFKPVPNTIACSLEKFIDAKTVRLAFGEDDDEGKKKDGDGDGKSGEGESESSNKPEFKPEATNPDAPKPATDNSKLEALLQHAAQIGIVVPSDTNVENLIDNFLTAFQTYNAVMQKKEAEEKEAEEEKPATVASPGYASMSTETHAAVEYANTLHRERIGERLDKLLETGRCTPDEARGKKADSSAVRLSLDTDKKPIQSDLEKWIAAREPLPAGTFWDATQKTKLSTEAEPPRRDAGQETDEEVNSAVEAQLKAVGRLANSK